MDGFREDGGCDESRLQERVKELSCLYSVAAAFVEFRGSPRECLRRIVAMLPNACRYPERVEARLTLDGVIEATDGFDRTSRHITSVLEVAGRERGEVTLGYAEPAQDAGSPGGEPFLDEERSLLDTVARQVGVFIESVESEQQRVRMEMQLQHADRLATIGQLAAGVAHELNEPLGNVLGFAQLALRTPDLPEQTRTDLGRIVQAVLHGREIIRKLLVFARQAPASKSLIDINAVVEEALFLLEAGCENPRIRFVRRLSAGLPRVEADAVQVRQVISNLVINAIQSMEAGGTITVGTEIGEGEVVLTVEDTGAGMAPDVARRAFDPFFTTKEVGSGTGLGLAVVQGIVAGHGGTVELSSEPARGTTFRVRLPAPPLEPGAHTLVHP